MLIYRVFGFAFLLVGFGMVFGAKSLVKKYDLDKKVNCNFEGELSEDEVQNYKLTKASVNVKMLGLLVSVPGLVFILLAFK
jgi:hypothetical protein